MTAAMMTSAIKAGPNAPEFATMWPLGNKYQSCGAGFELRGQLGRRRQRGKHQCAQGAHQ